MSNYKYSRPPWYSIVCDETLVSDGNVVLNDDEDSPRICIIERSTHECRIGNALLVTAAPNLYEALAMQEDNSLLQEALRASDIEEINRIFDKWLGEDTYKAPEVRLGEFTAMRKEKRREALALARGERPEESSDDGSLAVEEG